MFILSSILFVLIVLVILFLFRSMGRMGRQPAGRERVRHSADDGHHRGPRASGLN